MTELFAAAPPQVGMLNGPIFGALLGVLAALMFVWVRRRLRQRK